MNLESANALSIEAAASRIQQAAASDSASSTSGTTSTGYSSDGEESIGDTSFSSSAPSKSLEGNNSSSGTSTPSDTSSISSNEGIDAEISYLKLKQEILEKASAALKREEAFTALKAHSILRGDFSHGSKIWSEARCILDVLKKDAKS